MHDDDNLGWLIFTCGVGIWWPWIAALVVVFVAVAAV